MKEQDVGQIADSIKRLADAITPFSAQPGQDAVGGYVASLTEAMMGHTEGLLQIARAIEDLAEAVRETIPIDKDE